MKNLYLRLSLILVALCASISINAYDFVVNGIYYNKLTNTTCEVTYNTNPENSYFSDVTIPASVTYGGQSYKVTGIGDFAFRNCESLTKITLPSGITSIGLSAFRHCFLLTNIVIPEGVTIINQGAFAGDSYLTSVSISSSVTTIGPNVFEKCIGLTSINIPKSVTSIDVSAFKGCTGLTKVIVSDRDSYCKIAFANEYSNPLYYAKHLYTEDDTEISSISIPEGVTSIGGNTFRNDEGLKEVTIPESVTEIDTEAFKGCSSLASVISKNPTPPTISTVAETYSISNMVTSFDDDVYTTATLYVPTGSKEAYENAEYWKNFQTIVEFAPTGIDEVNAMADGSKVKSRYTVNGQATNSLQKGLNIIRFSDGTTRKVMVK